MTPLARRDYSTTPHQLAALATQLYNFIHSKVAVDIHIANGTIKANGWLFGSQHCIPTPIIGPAAGFDCAAGNVFSGVCRFPNLAFRRYSILTSFALNTSMLKAAQISSVTRSKIHSAVKSSLQVVELSRRGWKCYSIREMRETPGPTEVEQVESLEGLPAGVGRKGLFVREFVKLFVNSSRLYRAREIVAPRHIQCRLLSQPVVVPACTSSPHLFRISGATMVERLACSPPTKAIGVQSPVGSLRIFACGNRAGRCRLSAGFLGNLPSPPPPPFHSGAAPYSPKSP
ncbi:hypothetical protein PR048_007084 [Dryococelus australis]|uniref:Uncharacterized protein n=1 Tax=Dryococelus australis TaxID=614101 RepID=A0ABQ9IDZ0_9NEOP|nr:hypothetical protein PR048_007084 [Dryococelus australis]